MTIYITKVWGFGEPCGPLQFSTEGWRDNARRILKPGDLVVLVGTKGAETETAEQGRLLGMMEPTTEVVLSQDFDMSTRDVDFDEQGNYRWPYGLLNRHAWILQQRPKLEDISSRQFNMDSALGIVPLTDPEAAAVMQLEKREVELLSPVRARARIEGEEAARRRGAPPPTTTRAGVMHIRRAPAYTYLMEIEGATRLSFKIGWAFDYKARERQFNGCALPQIGGVRYRTKLYRLWDTADMAFRMEQELLRKFSAAQHPSNREVIYGVPFLTIEATWINQIQRLSRSPAG